MTKKEILTVLGIEQENYTKEELTSFVSQFRELNKTYEANCIWLAGDYIYYRHCGNVVARTQDLVAVL